MSAFLFSCQFVLILPYLERFSPLERRPAAPALAL